MNGTSNGALCTVQDLVAQKYDYVVVGGGTAGLVVAARLTEDPKIRPDHLIGLLASVPIYLSSKQTA